MAEKAHEKATSIMIETTVAVVAVTRPVAKATMDATTRTAVVTSSTTLAAVDAIAPDLLATQDTTREGTGGAATVRMADARDIRKRKSTCLEDTVSMFPISRSSSSKK